MLHFRSQFAVKPHMHIVSWSPSHLENHSHLELSFDFQLSQVPILVTYTSWNITSVLISCQFLMLIITSVLIRVEIFSFQFWSPWQIWSPWCLEYHFCLDQRVNFQCHSPGRGPSLFFWPRNEKFCHFIIRKSYFVIQFQLLEIENHEDGWKGVNYREIAERWF